MSIFYPTQPIRVVSCFPNSLAASVVGKEGFVVRAEQNWPSDYGYIVVVPGFPPPYGEWFFMSDQLEPIRYLPDAEDLQVKALEGSPLTDCPLPVRAA